MSEKKKIRYGAVITAAGMSMRMEKFKQLMKIGGISFAERVIMNFIDAGVGEIVMVTGFNSDELEQHLKNYPIIFVHNTEYENTDMLHSVKLGLRTIEGKTERVFFCPVDVPLFTLDTVKSEMEAEGDVIIPVCCGKDGHPLLLCSELIPRILSYEGDGGLNEAYKSAPDMIVNRIEVPDEGAVIDADTYEDFEKLVTLNSRRVIHTEA